MGEEILINKKVASGFTENDNRYDVILVKIKQGVKNPHNGMDCIEVTFDIKGEVSFLNGSYVEVSVYGMDITGTSMTSRSPFHPDPDGELSHVLIPIELLKKANFMIDYVDAIVYEVDNSIESYSHFFVGFSLAQYISLAHKFKLANSNGEIEDYTGSVCDNGVFKKIKEAYLADSNGILRKLK